jgi:ADP-ribose pyrophosphatase YjhB (NUDIX family)
VKSLAQREFPDAPIVGVGAVVLDGNQVLLVRRGQEPMKGEWSIPGGVLDLGETLESAVRREVLEETGLQVETRAIVEVLDKVVVENRRVRYHYVLIDFLCVGRGGTLRAGSDADDARWISHKELASHGIYHLEPATVAVIEKAFGMAFGMARASNGKRG